MSSQSVRCTHPELRCELANPDLRCELASAVGMAIGFDDERLAAALARLGCWSLRRSNETILGPCVTGTLMARPHEARVCARSAMDLGSSICSIFTGGVPRGKAYV